MIRKLKEKLSILLSRKPGKVVIMVILFINVAFVLLSACVISGLSLQGTEHLGFWESVFYTITMILDAGCIQFVVADIGAVGVATVIICLVIIIIGMILFTGAVIGYLTNYISNFIDNANGGSHKLVISNHTVIINWNSRASEIINDLLYNNRPEKVVVLVPGNKENIIRDIDERIEDTILTENRKLKQSLQSLPWWRRSALYNHRKLHNKLTILVREGDTYSTKQLMDISVPLAKTIIILGNDESNSVCEYKVRHSEQSEEGNPQTIKTLMQVAEFTSATESMDNQKIVVEVEDDWTMETVNMIIQSKQVEGKCNIVPVSINQILGQLLSQFSIMPELNKAYYELLSNKGVTFYARPTATADEHQFVAEQLQNRYHSIPLTVMDIGGQHYGYYAAEHEDDDRIIWPDVKDPEVEVHVNRSFWLERRNVIILGHNNKLKHIMAGFDSFRDEWNFPGGGEVLNVIVIQDKAHIERMDNYRAYPYVNRVIEAEIYDKELICSTIEQFVDENEGDTSVLVLSDDNVPADEIDSHSITNLIYIRDIILKKKRENSNFDEGRIDVVVEIINPKHFDVVKNYNIQNVVISNRYISKMIGQLGEKDVMFDFYKDILSYDESNDSFRSKELYVKKAHRFFDELPPTCTVAQLVRAVYQATSDPALPEALRTCSILLGVVKVTGEIMLFSGDQTKAQIAIAPDDKLIMFASH